MSAVTVTELLDEIREARDAAIEAANRYRDADLEYVAAKTDHDAKWNSAFIAHKQGKASDALAKAKADLDVADEREHMDRLLADKRHAKVVADTWEGVLRGLSAASWALQQELKMEQVA